MKKQNKKSSTKVNLKKIEEKSKSRTSISG
jgi:hypothetical protein